MFYVYELIDPRDGQVFYVGKGCGNRDCMTLRAGNSEKMAVIRAIKKAGRRVICSYFADGLSEAEAFKIERQRIAHHTYACLTNIQPGSRAPYTAVLERASDYLNRLVPFSDDWPTNKKLLWLLVKGRLLLTMLEIKRGDYARAQKPKA